MQHYRGQGSQCGLHVWRAHALHVFILTHTMFLQQKMSHIKHRFNKAASA